MRDAFLVSARRAWNAFWFREFSPEFFRFYRAILFLGAAYFAWEAWEPMRPCADWRPVGLMAFFDCRPEVFDHFRWAAVAFSLLAAVGVRHASKLAFVALVFEFGHINSFGKVANSWHLLVAAVGLASFVRDPRRDGWLIMMIRGYTVWVYFVNGLAKLRAGGVRWALSDNLYLVLSGRGDLGPLGQALVEGAHVHLLAFGAAIVLFVVELGAPLALVSARLGYVYFGIWTAFHVSVTLLLGGHNQFYSQLVVAAVFLPLGVGVWKSPSGAVYPKA